MDMNWQFLWKYMAWIDVVLVVAVSVGILIGLNKGLGKMLCRVIEVLIAQVITLQYYQPLAQVVSIRIPIPISLLEILSFAFLAIISMIAVLILLRLASAVAIIEFRPFVRNVAGGLIGGAYFVFLMSFLSSFLLLFPMPWLHASFYGRSLSGNFLTGLAPLVHASVQPFIPKSLFAP